MIVYPTRLYFADRAFAPDIASDFPTYVIHGMFNSPNHTRLGGVGFTGGAFERGWFELRTVRGGPTYAHAPRPTFTPLHYSGRPIVLMQFGFNAPVDAWVVTVTPELIRTQWPPFLRPKT